MKNKSGIVIVLACLVLGGGAYLVFKGAPRPADNQIQQKTSGETGAKDVAKKAKHQEVQKPKPVSTVLTGLDIDGNGLYDDSERKAMLDAMKKADPQLKITFDLDNDGRVTHEEQTKDRHPLSQLVSKANIVKSNVKIPWSFNIFPEWISSAYLQDDVADGKVASITPWGVVAKNMVATQENAANQPSKVGPGSGIEFAANSGQYLELPRNRDARWSYRWCIFTFRIDGSTVTDKETVMVDINSGNGPFRSSPKIAYSKKNGLYIRYTGINTKGLDHRIMSTPDVFTDGKTWNVVVCGIRYGQMFASVNGRKLTTENPQPPRFSTEWVTDKDAKGYIGSPQKGNAAWAMDALVFGQTEPTEAMVQKMTGWAAYRLKFEDKLPAGHPYKTVRPVLDAEDFPYRYVHDDEKWTEWGTGTKDKSFRMQNAGGQKVEAKGFERVFYDDFRADRVTYSANGAGDLWTGPGYNTAVGASASLVRPKYKGIDAYPYDKKNQKQTLSLVKSGKRWFASAFYSVNEMGWGYTWAGPKVFRIRCMFPKIPQKELAGGLFPAFWSYGIEWLFWRTSNRIENDWFEFDGQNGKWYNGVATHYHYPHVKNMYIKNNNRYKSYKVYSGELTEKKGKIPGGFYFWDGQYHTWEFIIEKDMFYVNVTVKGKDGKDRWVEVCRARTAPTYLERQDLQLDYALKAKHGYPKDGKRQDFVVDWIEVLQKTDDINKIPAPFTRKPELEGRAAVGSVITCKPNVKGISDVRYFWYADGYPLTYGTENSYKVTPEMAGTQIRCMVKAVGALDQPEAWTAPMMIGK